MNARLLLSALALVVVAVLLSCSDDPTEPKRPTPADIAAVSGDSQTGEVGTPLEAELAVVVRDQQGRPLAGAKVNWASEDGGTFSGSGESDAQGVARTSWTLGPVAGQQVASAQVGGLPTVRFTATAVPGPATELVVIGDSVLQGFASQQVPDSIIVEARDAHGNTVASAPLEWLVVAGGGSIEGPETTREDGRAAGLWTLGPDDGPQQIAVALPQIDSVRITASAFSPNTSTRVQIDSTVPAKIRSQLSTVHSTAGTAALGGILPLDTVSPTVFAIDSAGNPILAGVGNAGVTILSVETTADVLLAFSHQMLGGNDAASREAAVSRARSSAEYKALITAIAAALSNGELWMDSEQVQKALAQTWVRFGETTSAGSKAVAQDETLEDGIFTVRLEETEPGTPGFAKGLISVEVDSWLRFAATERYLNGVQTVEGSGGFQFAYSSNQPRHISVGQNETTAEQNLNFLVDQVVGIASSVLPTGGACIVNEAKIYLGAVPAWIAARNELDGMMALRTVWEHLTISTLVSVALDCVSNATWVSIFRSRWHIARFVIKSAMWVAAGAEVAIAVAGILDFRENFGAKYQRTFCISGGNSGPCVASLTPVESVVRMRRGETRELAFVPRSEDGTVLENRDLGWGSLSGIIEMDIFGIERHPVRAVAPGETLVLVTHGDVTGELTVVVEDSEDEGEGGDGGSSGDPHLLTIDGLAYDFMGTGDYILVTSTNSDDRFEVQARHKRLGTSQVSANDAVAVRGPGSVVNVFSSPTTVPRILADGEEIPSGDGTHLLPDGTTLAVNGGVVWISHPDGTMVGVGLHLDQVGWIHTHLPQHRRGAVEGLLGNFDGDASNDLRIRGGEVLSNPTHRQLHTAFRDSWRVPLGSAESLFVEGPDLYDASFPSAPITLADLDPAVVERAEEVCRAAGVRHKATLEGCILDVALTGDDSWARAAYESDPTIVRIRRISPAAGYIRPGESLDLEAVVGGITNDPINWSATGGTVTPSGRSRARYVAPDAPGVYEVRATIAGTEPAVAVMNVAGGRVRTWTGARTSGWRNAQNWEPEGIPTEGDTAVIPAGTPRQPLLSQWTAGHQVRSLIVEPGATVSIDNAVLTVIEEFINEGEFVSLRNPKLILLGDTVNIRGQLPSLEVHGIAHVTGNVDFGSGTLYPRGARMYLNGHTLRALAVIPDAASRIFMASPLDSLIVERHLTVIDAASTVTSGVIVAPSIGIPEHFEAPSSVRVTINTNGSNARISMADSTSSFSVLEIGGSHPIADYNRFAVTDSLVVSDPISIAGRGVIVMRGVLSTIEGSEWLGNVELYHRTGTSLVEGDFRPVRVTFAGEEQLIRGGLGYDQLYVGGTATFDGDANADRLQVSGELTVPDGATIDVGTLYLEDGAVLRNFGRILYGSYQAAATAIVEGNPPEPRDDP